MKIKPISISVVSHGQFELLKKLLIQIERHSEIIEKVIITINTPEQIPNNKLFRSELFKWIFNKSSLGFSQNHNNAFKECKSDYFCILNPDILIKKDTFEKVLFIKEQYGIGIIGPSLIDLSKNKQVNARKFPSVLSTLYNFNKSTPQYYKCIKNKVGFTDWVGGMFMLISSSDFKLINGFDERFLLYFEDVDICLKAKNKGLSVAEFNGLSVIHNARRTSHKSIRYFFIHLYSFFKFFLKNKNFIF